MPSTPRSMRVEAVVLRHSDWGEADRILTVFTREQGKLRLIAKGVRKVRSRKAGHLEPFTQVALMLAHGRDFWLVTQAETVEAFQPLRENLVLTGNAAYVIELLDRFTYEEGENRSLYQLVVDSLTRLSAGEDIFTVVRYYEVRLLDNVGFRPQLFQCVHCRAEILPQDQYFSALQGGVLCPNCGRSQPGALPISMEALKVLRHYQRSSFAEARRLEPTPGVQREVETLMQHFLTYLLERGLNSPEFLRAVQR